MSEWQPIETAPKDGTSVDLWVVPRGFSAGGGRVCDAWFFDGQWWVYAEDGDEQNRGKIPNEIVTHWMPPPEPPRDA